MNCTSCIYYKESLFCKIVGTPVPIITTKVAMSCSTYTPENQLSFREIMRIKQAEAGYVAPPTTKRKSRKIGSFDDFGSTRPKR